MAPDLDGLDFMEGLEEEAVEVGLVAGDLGEGIAVREHADARLEVKVFGGHGFLDRHAGHRLVVAGIGRQLLRHHIEDDTYLLGLVVRHAAEPPEDLGDAGGELGLQVALGFKARQDASEVTLPVLPGLDLPNDWRG